MIHVKTNFDYETYSKDNVKIRKYRTKIKEKIISEEEIKSKNDQSSAEETDDDLEDDSDN